MFQVLRNKFLFVIYYLLSTGVLIYIKSNNSTNSFMSNQSNDIFRLSVITPYSILIIGNIVLSVFLFIFKENILAAFEIRKTKKAYENARNRVQFFHKNQIVCLEGTIEAQDPSKTLTTPITRQRAVAFSYGNPHVSGGMEQIPSVIKPAGESVALNGLLSFDYFPFKSYDPKEVNLSHFREYINQKKESTKEVNTLDLNYLTNTFPKLNASSFHNTVPHYNDSLFLNSKYIEKLIPYGIYGWVIGKWGKNKELLPLKFSNCIFAVEKDYRKDFHGYISEQAQKYSRNAMATGFFVFFIMAIFLVIIMF